MSTKIKLDLHGFPHDEVRPALIRTIEDFWNVKDLEMEIVTGHSPRMKEIVEEVLNEYKLDFVKGDPFNSGYIKVRV